VCKWRKRGSARDIELGRDLDGSPGGGRDGEGGRRERKRRRKKRLPDFSGDKNKDPSLSPFLSLSVYLFSSLLFSSVP
jgi:hypothetical protein